MVDFKTYFTEATKKDILAGLDANANLIKKAQEYTDKAMTLRKHFNDIDRKYPRWSVVKTKDRVDHIENKKNKHIQEENEKYLEQKMHDQFDHLVADPFPYRDKFTFYTYLTPYILTLDYYYDNGNIIPLPRETERAKEMINLLFFSVLKYKEVGEYFYDNLKKIDRKYQVGHDADELGEPDDDQEIDEATKKDVLAGLDKFTVGYFEKKFMVYLNSQFVSNPDDYIQEAKNWDLNSLLANYVAFIMENYDEKEFSQDARYTVDEVYNNMVAFAQEKLTIDTEAAKYHISIDVLKKLFKDFLIQNNYKEKLANNDL